MNKIIIIVWKWVGTKKTLPEGTNHFVCNVSDSEGDMLVGFTKQRKREYTANEIETEYKKHLANDNEVLLLLHTNWGTEIKNVIEEIIEKCRTDKTGLISYHTIEGPGYIYDKLLTGTGQLKNSACHEENGKILIEKTVFDEVWDEYAVKKKIEKIKEEIHEMFSPLCFDIEGLKKTATKKRKDYLLDIYESKKVPGSAFYYRNLLLKFFYLIAGLQFDHNLEPFVSEKEDRASLMNVKNDENKSEKTFKKAFKEHDIGLINDDYKKVDWNAPIVKFMLDMDELPGDAAGNKFEDIEKMEFWKKYVDDKNPEFDFPTWYCELFTKIKEFEKKVLA